MDRVARRGPLARAPGALKGDTSEIVHIFVAVKGGPFWEKTNFRKKSHNAEKLKGGTLWDFSTSILSQNIIKMQGDPLGGKFFSKKSLAVPKKMKGGPFGLARYGMLRGKTGKTLLVHFARPNSAIWCNNIL